MSVEVNESKVHTYFCCELCICFCYGLYHYKFWVCAVTVMFVTRKIERQIDIAY
jgi:hypothetical protein